MDLPEFRALRGKPLPEYNGLTVDQRTRGLGGLLTMWYFGTHGDLTMAGPKPEDGPEGLKRYDPEAYAIFDDFYSGRIPVARVSSIHRRQQTRTQNPERG